MSLHSVRPTTPPHQLASRLLPDIDTQASAHRQTLARALRGLARRGEWHAFWCRLGDAVDEATDIAIAWAAVVLGAIAVVGAGAVIGFAAGPVAAAAYAALVVVVVALYRQWLGRRPE